MHRLVFFCVFLIGVCFFITNSHAAQTQQNIMSFTPQSPQTVSSQPQNQQNINMNTMMGTYEANVQSTFGALKNSALTLFFYLAGIQLIISMIYLMFKNSPIELAVKFFELIFAMAFFYTLIKYAGTWIPYIINIFISFGQSAAGPQFQCLNPSEVFNVGLFGAMRLYSNVGQISLTTGMEGLADGIALIILSVVIIVIFAIIAAEVLYIIIKAYILISLSGLFFAFGASEYTRNMAVNYFRAVIGTGLQILVLYIIVGIGSGVMNIWIDSISVPQSASWIITMQTRVIGLLTSLPLSAPNVTPGNVIVPAFEVVAGGIILLMLSIGLPSWIASLSGIGGQGSGFAGQFMGVAVGGAAAAASIAATGTGVVAGAGRTVVGGVQGAVSTAKLLNEHAAATGSDGKAIKKTAAGLVKATGGAMIDHLMEGPRHSTSLGQKVRDNISGQHAQLLAQRDSASPKGTPHNTVKNSTENKPVNDSRPSDNLTDKPEQSGSTSHDIKGSPGNTQGDAPQGDDPKGDVPHNKVIKGDNK